MLSLTSTDVTLPVHSPDDRQEVDRVLLKIDQELGVTSGPWFLTDTGGPSIVDLTYVPHLERMAASCAYWKGFQIRGNARYPNVNRWFEALEERPTYRATQSDFYTHVTDIPPVSLSCLHADSSHMAVFFSEVRDCFFD